MGDPSERPSGAFTPLSPQAIIEQRLPGEGGRKHGQRGSLYPRQPSLQRREKATAKGTSEQGSTLPGKLTSLCLSFPICKKTNVTRLFEDSTRQYIRSPQSRAWHVGDAQGMSAGLTTYF